MFICRSRFSLARSTLILNCRAAPRNSHNFTLSITNRPPLLARSAYGVEESLTRALDPDRLFTLIRHHHPRINQGTHHKQAGQLFYARRRGDISVCHLRCLRDNAALLLRFVASRTVRFAIWPDSAVEQLCLSQLCQARRALFMFSELSS